MLALRDRFAAAPRGRELNPIAQRAQEGDDAALELALAGVTPLALQALGRWGWLRSPEAEDVAQEAALVLVRALREGKWNRERAGWASFSLTTVNFSLRGASERRKRDVLARASSLDAPPAGATHGDEREPTLGASLPDARALEAARDRERKLEARDEVAQLLPALDALDRELLAMLFGLGKRRAKPIAVLAVDLDLELPAALAMQGDTLRRARAAYSGLFKDNA